MTVKHLRIQLGLRCNARCDYCLQAPFKAGIEPHATEDVEWFLSTLPGWQPVAPESIEIWGGEPLVYGGTLKKLVPGLRKLYPRAGFFLSTNGLRLDRDWIDFFLSNDVAVAISHDGPGHRSLRGRDPLATETAATAIRELIAERPDLTCFNFVLTPENFDIAAIDRWFFERFPGLRVQPNVDWVVQCYDERHLARFSFDEEAGPRLTEIVRGRLAAPGRRSFHLERLVSAAMTALEAVEAGGEIEYFADAPGCLTVDLRGRVLASHNFSGPSNILGRVASAGITRAPPAVDAAARERCRACAVFASCRGQTYRATARLETANCANQRYFHAGLLAVARDRLKARRRPGLET